VFKSDHMSEGTENSFSTITQEKIILNCCNVVRMSALERPSDRVYALLGACLSTRVMTKNIVNVRRVLLLCSFVVPRNWVWGVVAGLTHYRCTYKWTQYFWDASLQKCWKKSCCQNADFFLLSECSTAGTASGTVLRQSFFIVYYSFTLSIEERFVLSRIYQIQC